MIGKYVPNRHSLKQLYYWFDEVYVSSFVDYMQSISMQFVSTANIVIIGPLPQLVVLIVTLLPFQMVLCVCKTYLFLLPFHLK